MKIYEKGETIDKKNALEDGTANDTSWNNNPKGHLGTPDLKVIGYTDCGCNAGWESGIVLDPFIGSGTTAKVALKQRKRFIGIDIKQEYVDMSYRKIARVQQKIF